MDVEVCLFKKYSNYNVNDEIWLKTCDASNTNSAKAMKYHFSYDQASGLIKSLGSVAANENKHLCLKLNSATRFGKQRVKLARCDSENVLQQFDFVDGKIYPRSEHRLCASYEYNKFEAAGTTALIFSTCFPGALAINLDSMV